MYEWGHVCQSTCVEVKGQLCGVGSFLPSLDGSADRTQVTRFGWQEPLPTKACHQPLLFKIYLFCGVGDQTQSHVPYEVSALSLRYTPTLLLLNIKFWVCVGGGGRTSHILIYFVRVAHAIWPALANFK